MPLKSIFLGDGILDSDHRGNVRVTLHNLSNNRTDFDVGDRIAQVLFQKRNLQDSLKFQVLIILPQKKVRRDFDQREYK